MLLDAECAAAMTSQKETSDITGRMPCLDDQSWPAAMIS